MKKQFKALHSALMEMTLAGYWRASRELKVLLEKHSYEDIWEGIEKARSRSLLRNLHGLWNWTEDEIRVRPHISLRHLLRLLWFDQTALRVTNDNPKFAAALLSARRTLVRTYPRSSRSRKRKGKRPARKRAQVGKHARWLARLEHSQQGFWYRLDEKRIGRLIWHRCTTGISALDAALKAARDIKRMVESSSKLNSPSTSTDGLREDLMALKSKFHSLHQGVQKLARAARRTT